GDLLTGSASGETRFVFKNDGSLLIGTTSSQLTNNLNAASILATGAASFSSFAGSGLTDCNSAVATLKWDELTKRFSCGSAVGQVKSFVDSTTDTGVDNNTTDYWD